MPTYEYVCEKCDHRFEKVQSIVAKPLTICPEDLCRLKKWGKGNVKKLISAGAGLIFKGSGFYITDYRSDKYKEAAKKETAAATPGGSEAVKTGASGGGESKSATTPASGGGTAKSETAAAPKKSKTPASE